MMTVGLLIWDYIWGHSIGISYESGRKANLRETDNLSREKLEFSDFSERRTRGVVKQEK